MEAHQRRNPMPPRRRRARLAARLTAVALAIPLLAACGGAGPSGGIAVTDAWARASSKTAAAAAAYLTIANEGTAADALRGATSDVATTVEIHETMAMDAPASTDGEGGMDGGMMGMRPVGRLAIPAGATVRLEPGGYHLMLIGLERELEVGATIEIILTFEEAGEITVEAEVRER